MFRHHASPNKDIQLFFFHLTLLLLLLLLLYFSVFKMKVIVVFAFVLLNAKLLRGTLLVAQLVEALRYKPEVRGFDSRWCHWNFSLTVLPATLWPWGRSASNRNEYQKYFLWVKAAGA
jgi:hypothetical protein